MSKLLRAGCVCAGLLGLCLFARAAAPTDTETAIETQNALAEGERSGSAPARTASPVISRSRGTVSASSQANPAVSSSTSVANPASAAKAARTTAVSAPAAAAPPKKAFNPNEYRPGVTWLPSQSTHFTIYTQKRSGGIGSSNMSLTFESAYATLRRHIPWMMSDKVRVFVYQDHDSYLKYEPQAKAWTRALAYPVRGEIVVYDEPGKQKELQEVFTHELVHIFTQQYFATSKTDQLMTPTWLDEGLAVYMEDQAYNGLKGGPWTEDMNTLNFLRRGNTPRTPSAAGRWGKAKPARKGKPLFLVPFGQFMQEGSLAAMEKNGQTQEWYFQAFLMVRFLLNPSGSSSPSNRMQFEQFTRLLAKGNPMRDAQTGYLVKDAAGRPVYRRFSAQQALGRAYYYGDINSFENAFWNWAEKNR